MLKVVQIRREGDRSWREGQKGDWMNDPPDGKCGELAERDVVDRLEMLQRPPVML